MAIDESGEHFRSFQAVLTAVIDRTNSPSHKQQVDNLVKLEDQFRRALIRHRNGEVVYQAFIAYICDVRRNILAARPYFRERHDGFTNQVARALESRNWRRLLPCRINYQFVHFAMSAAKWKPRSQPAVIARKIIAARHAFVETNLPLAISEARRFYQKTPKSHLSFMDEVQLCAEGLISSLDKFEGPYTDVYKGVAVNWMKGNLIEAYSATMLHFYPKDKRRIYRANKFMAKHPHGSFDVEDMVAAINTDLPERSKTSEDEIRDLVAAASTVSSDTKAPGEADDVPDNVARYAAPDDCRPDVRFEKAEVVHVMYRATAGLPLVDRKMLRLMGMKEVLLN